MLSNEDLASLLPRVALGDRAAVRAGVPRRLRASVGRCVPYIEQQGARGRGVAGGFHECVARRGWVRWLGGAAMTWLINIVRNKAIDALRSGRTERASILALDEEAMAVAADATQQPQALLERSLEKLRITGCMAELGAPQRQALALAYYHGMVHTEIAETLGAPLGTVKAWVRRGLDKLKGCLDAAGVRGGSLA